jgi:hypothetical protein
VYESTLAGKRVTAWWMLVGKNLFRFISTSGADCAADSIGVCMLLLKSVSGGCHFFKLCDRCAEAAPGLLFAPTISILLLIRQGDR